MKSVEISYHPRPHRLRANNCKRSLKRLSLSLIQPISIPCPRHTALDKTEGFRGNSCLYTARALTMHPPPNPTSSEIVATYAHGARVVTAFNSVTMAWLGPERSPRLNECALAIRLVASTRIRPSQSGTERRAASTCGHMTARKTRSCPAASRGDQ